MTFIQFSWYDVIGKNQENLLKMINKKNLEEIIEKIEFMGKFPDSNLTNIPFGMKLAYALSVYKEDNSLNDITFPDKMENYLNPEITVQDNVSSFPRYLGDLTQCEAASGFKAFLDNEKIILPEDSANALSKHIENTENLRAAGNEYNKRIDNQNIQGLEKLDQKQLEAAFKDYVKSQDNLQKLKFNFKSEIYGIDNAINDLKTRQNSGKNYTLVDILHTFATNINEPQREIEEAKKKIDKATTPDKKNQLEREYVKTVLKHQVEGNIPIPKEIKNDIYKIRDSQGKMQSYQAVNRELDKNLEKLAEKIAGKKGLLDKFMDFMESVLQFLGIGEDYYREQKRIETLKVELGIKDREPQTLERSQEKSVGLDEQQNLIEKKTNQEENTQTLDNERQKLSTNKQPEKSALKQKTPKYVSEEAQEIIKSKEINDENLMSVKYSFETKFGKSVIRNKLIPNSYKDIDKYQKAKLKAKQSPDYQDITESNRGSINFKDFEVHVCCLVDKEGNLLKLIDPNQVKGYEEICEKNNYKIKHFTLPIDQAIEKFKGELQFCESNPTQNTYAPEDIKWLKNRVEKCESLQNEIKNVKDNIKIDDKSLNKSKELNETNKSKGNEL